MKESSVRRLLSNEPLTRSIIEAGDTDVVTDVLTPEDAQHCAQLVIEGFHYFSKLNWTSTKEANFLARPSVRREMDRLLSQLQDAEGLEQRSKFFARLRMLQMLPGAMAIVQKTLVGATMGARPSQVPTMEQYQAARDIIEWCGIRGGVDKIGTMNVQIINPPKIDRHSESSAEIADRYDPKKILQRQTVRDVLDKILDINIRADRELDSIKKIRADTIRAKKKKKRKIVEQGDE